MFTRAKHLVVKAALIMAIAMPVYSSIDVTSAEAGSRKYRRAAIAAGVVVGGIVAYNSYRRYKRRDDYYRAGYNDGYNRSGYYDRRYNDGYYDNRYRAGAYYRPRRVYRRAVRREVRRDVRRGYYHHNHYHRHGSHRHRH